MIESSTGARWLSGPIRPIVPTIPVTASSSGTPAATSVPNAMTSRISVIGSDPKVALARSLSKTSMNCSSVLPDPNCSTLKSACDFWAAAVWARVWSTVAATASSLGSPGISKLTSTEWPSPEIADGSFWS